jgi:hypothetical protein
MAGAIVAQIMAGYPWGGILALVSWGFSIYALNRIGGNNY